MSRADISRDFGNIEKINFMNKKKILKIVLTGGPMAGKSSILLYLQRHYQHKVEIIPEIATSFKKNFFKDKFFFTKLLNKDLSKLFFNLQLQLESIYLKVAKQKGVEFIVCDRGLFDGAAYYNGSLEEFLITNKTSPEEIFKRYDAVIWLETLTKIDKKESFNVRPLMKNEEDLILQISNNNLQDWSGHNNFYSIRKNTLKEKNVAVINIINNLLEENK